MADSEDKTTAQLLDRIVKYKWAQGALDGYLRGLLEAEAAVEAPAPASGSLTRVTSQPLRGRTLTRVHVSETPEFWSAPASDETENAIVKFKTLDVGETPGLPPYHVGLEED